jgi:phospholipid/cholesterol/gamma-HCH transport system substrate-binding protein
MIESPLRIDRQVVYGLLFVVLVGALIAGTIAQYRGAFEDNVEVTLQADRAGLTLAKGAPIKLHGVEIGTVGRITTDGKAVTIGLELDAASARHVPADVTAQIVPPTAFGAKYVQLTPSRGGSTKPVAAGAVIPATRVTVEVN